MRRYLPRLVLTGALLSPATLHALGLGEIRLNSALNQPFDAEIELIAPTSEELATLKVGLASHELFERLGFDRPAFLSNFDFSVTRGRDGRAWIKVTSTRSVTEPFVTLLVEANWGRGRLLREYTVLLDPPVFMPSQPETQSPISAPQSGARTDGRIERALQPEPSTATPAAVPAPEPAPAAQPVVHDVPPASSDAALVGSYTVERNDTLWRIASRIQPGASPRVINQTMIALFRANPHAFGGNINVLLAGSVLRIPEQSEIDAISAAEAANEVSRQQQEWIGAARLADSETSSRLRLVPPEESPSAPAPSAPVETSDAAPAGEPASVGAAVDDRRLAVTSPELAAAQRQVSEAPLMPEPQVEAEAVALAPGEQPAEEAETPAPPPAARTPVPQPAPAQPPQPDEPSFLDRLIAFWWVWVLLGLAAIGALAFWKRRREHTDLTDLDRLSDAGESVGFEPAATRAAAPARVEEPALETSDTGTFETVQAAVEQQAAADDALELDGAAAPAAAAVSSPDDTLSSDTAVRFDEQDALAEADFHMAYGLYDQAADLVKIAIDREPERRDLKLKLLEIYFVWGNKDMFLETARELNDSRDQAAAGEWDKVLIMGKQIAPDDPLFKGEGGPVDLVDVNLEGGENRVDVDLFAEPSQDEAGGEKSGLDLELSGGAPAAPAGDSSSLDFLLDDEPASQEDSTREMDQLARTQETPTIESPMLDRSSDTLREPIDTAEFVKTGTDQTAELALDDLGLDVDHLETTGSLEDTAALRQDSEETQLARPIGDDELTQLARPIGDDELTQLAPSLGALDRTTEAPRADGPDIESTGTIFIDQVDLSVGDTVEQRRPDVDATAALQRPADIDLNLDELDDAADSGDTVRQSADPDTEAAQFSDDVFGTDRTAAFPKVDLDVGDPLFGEDREPTNKVITAEMELSELEPVTMSEVGTKLDLARAYMDMGDPDGARSILEEVMQEGNSGQKQEAARLLESIR